jgi:hypothetical protein
MLGKNLKGAFAHAVALGTLILAMPALGGDCSCLGDLDQDGTVSGSDLGQLLGAWGTANTAADLDGNGVVNGADLGSLLGAWGPCAAIANDNCSGALVVGVGQHAFCTAGASTDGPEVSGCGTATQVYKDVWYMFEANSSGQLTLSTCNSADFDTVIAVYGAVIPGVSPCPTGGIGLATLVGCNDDGNGCTNFGSTLTVNVAAGHLYRIRVGGYYANESGSGTLSVSFTHPGESCANPRLTNSSLASQTIVGSTVDNAVAGLPGTCFGQQPQGPAEWVRWTAPCNGLVTFSTCNPGTNFDTVITVLRYEFDGNCWSTYIACNDDSSLPGCDISGTNRKSSITVSVDPGEVLFAVVSGWGGAAGAYELKIDRTCQ